MSEPPQQPLEAEEKVARQSGEKEDNDEDPLVIDEPEEKPAEVAEVPETEEANQEEENEKEFEPTVDMLMNEFDDEQTIDEEEALGQDDDDELSALQSEQDMPIEELLKLYGYNNSANGGGGAASQEPESSQPEENKTEEESEVVEEVEEEPTKEVAQAVPEVEDDDEEAESEPDAASNVQKGEKRSSSSPPPAKKARSELAKFYEATVEGRNLRSSAGLVDEEEDESGEEEAEEGKDYSWKKTIMIGPSYQAQVPGGLNNYDDTPPYENEDKLLWDPTRLSEDFCKEYLAKSGELQGATAALGVNGIPTGSHIRDDEQALLLLLQCGYNSDEALRRRRMNVVPPADTMSLWSEEECKAFETGLRVYGKDFHSIQNQKVGTRSVGELVQFYYLWKKTERHDVFANSFRIEKKKYTLHPGTTDYMERFMDEQDLARDRSVSPNFHSLIYGDTKRRSETKLESISNGAEKTRVAGEGDDGTLAEAAII